ncbi:MAG: helix-hairpin-helix domain-containing protein [Myxococcales bacterium]|nr:helix-hairpin-helix domain-containing protein [Myxococcales bacterium]
MYMPLIAALLFAAADPSASAAATESAAPQPKPARKKPGKPPMTGILNVNRATEAELRLLPGIGRKRAELIVERREKKPFASLEELSRMKGMRNLVHKLRANLAVQGDTTLRPVRP